MEVKGDGGREVSVLEQSGNKTRITVLKPFRTSRPSLSMVLV
jgi:hypothetical protein